MTTLMQASTQWASRPHDQRFVSLIEMHDFLARVRQSSRAQVVSSRSIAAAAIEHKDSHDGTTLRLVMRDDPNTALASTHWAFGQIAQKAGAPADYIRRLPAPIAADCLNYGLHHVREVEDVGVLTTIDNDSGAVSELRAVTGPQYGRVWNATIAKSLINRFGDGLTGDFRVPGEFGKAVEVTKKNTTIYASDRDMFVFLADERNRIEIPNRRDGKRGSLARGFFVWNSEVGYTSFGVMTFLFDYVCMNRIVWGAEDVQEIRLRHSASAPDRWIEQVAPAIEEYANSSSRSITDAIKAAQEKKLKGGKEALEKFLRNRFSKSETVAIQKAHMDEEQRPIESLWDVSVAVSAYAKSLPFQDERVKMEREAGAMIDLAIK